MQTAEPKIRMRALPQLRMLSMALFLGACAPSQSFRPAGALAPGHHHEVGVAFSTVEPRPYVIEPPREVAQGWWTTRLSERWFLSTLLAFDSSALAGGSALRFDYLQQSWTTLSAEVELGFAWTAVSLPLSLRPSTDSSFYCSPRLGHWGPRVTPFVPCGFSLMATSNLALRSEIELSWADLEYYNRRVHWGFSASHQW